MADGLAGLNPGIDFEALGRQMRAAPGFPHFCIDDFLEPAFADAIAAAFPWYREAGQLGHTFEALNERHKIQVTDARVFPAPIRRLHELLAAPAFVEHVSQMSGIPGLVADPALLGGGIHETNHGGRLDVHVDFNFHDGLGLFRRVNLLVYFNRDWRDAYGGHLDLWDEDVRHCIGRYAPLFNRAAGFATSPISWHGVTPLACPPGVARKSFAVYYYSPEPPPGWDGVKRSTVFRARPDEVWRGRVAMPLEGAWRSTRHALGAVRGRLRRLAPR